MAGVLTASIDPAAKVATAAAMLLLRIFICYLSNYVVEGLAIKSLLSNPETLTFRNLEANFRITDLSRWPERKQQETSEISGLPARLTPAFGIG
jgi:hypothetical protein